MDQAVDDFLKTVLRSGILQREELESVVRSAPVEIRDRPDDLADFFIKQGKLSRYQSRKLLQGISLGLIVGPYQILAPIGRGGMGSVYLALDQRNNQRLALKILPPKKAQEGERYLARFRREMELSRRVKHPNVALSYDVGESDGVYYIAMEYIPGMSLYRMVNKFGPLPVGRLARLAAEVCAGLDHAHNQGLVHRDLKPSNIMVTPKDHAKILDMGLALIEGEVVDDAEAQIIGGRGYVVGSMDYIAPEQTLDSAGVDARADIYSLGCTLYYALAGRPPFPGGNNRDKIKRHRSEEPDPLTRLNPALPGEFAQLVARMMAKNPEHRPPSAYDAREALLAWCIGEPVLPMDQQGDKNYQEAIAALELAEPSPETGADVFSFRPDPLHRPGSRDGPFIRHEQDNPKDFWWIAGGLLGFWLVLFAVLGLLLLLK
jgi:eukaryotic-like serine/threonine-protein kinase